MDNTNPNKRVKGKVLDFLSKHPVSVPTPEAPDKIPSALKFRNEHAKNNGHDTFIQWITDCGPSDNVLDEVMESYALLREQRAVEQAKEEWLKEKAKMLRAEYSWDTISILEKLSDATDVLLHEKDYDRHGWEEIEYAWGASKELIVSLKNLNNE